MALNRLKILQHNVLHWGGTRKISLANTYLTENPDIILLNGTGITDDNAIKIFPYRFYQQNRSGRTNDGVAIGIKPYIPHKITRDYMSETMSVTIQTRQGDMTIATAYLPPSRPYLPMRDFYRLHSLPHPCYLLGDLNASHRVFGYRNANAVGRQLVEAMGRGEWHHKGPWFKTWLGHHGATTPDIVLANKAATWNSDTTPGPPAAIDLTPGKSNGSDHVPVMLTLSTEPLVIPSAPRFCYKQANWEGYKANLARTLQPITLDGQPTTAIEEAVEAFYKAVWVAKKENIPMTTRRVKPHPKRSNLLSCLERQLENLRREERVSGWSREKYAEKMRITRDILQENKRLHREHWAQLLEGIAESHGDQKQFWGKVKRLRGNLGEANRTEYLINSQGQEAHSNEEKEHALREEWAPVFQITPEENARFNDEYERRVEATLAERGHELRPHDRVDSSRLDNGNWLLAPITPEDVKRIIKSFKNKKAPGTSRISKEDLVNLPPEGHVFLAEIFTACLSAGYFPKRFKHAKMIFIPKSGKDGRRPGNHRPISLLEVPGKILEKILNERITSYAEETPGVQDPNQYGFRPHRGCNKAIALGWEMVATHLAIGGSANIVSRDIQRAFDKVWHDGLRVRLLDVQLPNLLARIASDFLDGRTAHIQVQGVRGARFPLRAGTPQGSCLSPTLFIINTADTPPPVEEEGSTHIAYADDHTHFILAVFKHPTVTARRTGRNIEARNGYERDRKITNAQDKMKVVAAAKYKPKDIMVEGQKLDYTQETKMLGMRMTNYGLRNQVTYNQKSASRALTKLRRFTGLPPRSKLNLYKSLVLPKLTYPAVPLNTASRSALLTLQRVQNSALRWVHRGAPDRIPGHRYRTQELHELYNLEPLNLHIHRLAERIWENLERDEDPNLDRIRALEQFIGDDEREHRFYRRSRPRARAAPPRPLLTQEDVTG